MNSLGVLNSYLNFYITYQPESLLTPRSIKISCIHMHDIVSMLYAKYYGKIHWDTEPHFSYRVRSNKAVAKSNKSLSNKINTTWWNWNNSKKHSITTVAKEMLLITSNITDEDRIFNNILI